MTDNIRKAAAWKAIDAKTDEIVYIADQIWGYAELSLQEFKSAALYVDVLQEQGFAVEKGICGIETAFAASFGSGRPHIGILAEYDALSGLSQEGGSLERKELTPGGCGHGCGHNMLGAGAFGAALGIKAWLEATGTPGTVTLYGCPGEEGGAAKAFMAREGLWKELDCALAWHPQDVNQVVTGSCNSTIQVQYKYTGIASHAASAPEKGRSALDAVELLNIGVQFLREHISDRARIHYAITDAGGISPNVVQPKASVLYQVRSNHVSEAVGLLGRLDKIAEGAALMTETSVERKFIDGTADTVTNHALEKILYDNLAEVGAPSYTEEENAFADALSLTYEGHDNVPGYGAAYDENIRRQVAAMRRQTGHAMNSFIVPLYQGEVFEPASTDVGDVSWLTPAAQLNISAWPNGCPGHSWQNVSCGRTSIGHKAVITAAKVLAGAAVDLFADPTLLAAIRAEFTERTAGGYTCPIPEGAVPCLPDL